MSHLNLSEMYIHVRRVCVRDTRRSNVYVLPVSGCIKALALIVHSRLQT